MPPRRDGGNKQIKAWSTSLVTREIQSKASMKCHFTPIRRARLLKPTVANADKGAEQQDLTHVAGGNTKSYSHFRNQFGSFL